MGASLDEAPIIMSDIGKEVELFFIKLFGSKK